MTPDQQPITKADLLEATAQAVAELKASQDRVVESLIANISDLRNEMMRRFDQADRRFANIGDRLDRIDNPFRGL